jgi:hypothetical protein
MHSACKVNDVLLDWVIVFEMQRMSEANCYHCKKTVFRVKFIAIFLGS